MRDILAAIAIFVNGAKDYSALHLSRDLSVDYKTAFVLLHKVRESMEEARHAGALSGNVEVDGAYFGGYVKPANDKKERRKKIHQSGKRQSVIVMRERGRRTLTYITGTEADGVALVNGYNNGGNRKVFKYGAPQTQAFVTYTWLPKGWRAYIIDGACFLPIRRGLGTLLARSAAM